MMAGNPLPESGTAVFPQDDHCPIDWRLVNNDIVSDLSIFHRQLAERIVSTNTAEESFVTSRS